MIYLDSNVIIRLPEAAQPERERIERRLAPHRAFITSQMTRLECRCGPMRAGDAALLSEYDTFFSAPEMSLIDIDPAVIDTATAIRATHNFRAPDAIHLASAVVAGAAVMLTGDVQLARFRGVTVELL